MRVSIRIPFPARSGRKELLFLPKMSHWVYILYSESAKTFYKGQTDDLEKRLHRHNSGWEKATKHGVPWRLVWSTEKSDKSSATRLERKLKNLTNARLLRFMNKYADGVAGPDVTPEA